MRRSGRAFPDALAGAAVGLPVLLTERDSLQQATADAIEALDIEQVILLGGTSAVSTNVEFKLEDLTGNDAVRLAGSNRSSIATSIATAAFALDALGLLGDEVLLANGVVFADAVAGGPLGGRREAPLLLTEATDLNSETVAFLDDHSSPSGRCRPSSATEILYAVKQANSARGVVTADDMLRLTVVNALGEGVAVAGTANGNVTDGSDNDQEASTATPVPALTA